MGAYMVYMRHKHKCSYSTENKKIILNALQSLFETKRPVELKGVSSYTFKAYLTIYWVSIKAKHDTKQLLLQHFDLY